MAYMCLWGRGECDGCGDCQPKPPTCPVCGDDVYERVYRNASGDIVGCENCIEEVSVEESEV